jgi:RNA polymerase-binding transcription factor DksA
MDPTAFRKRLEDEREHVRATLEAIERRLAVPQSESGGELTLLDQHPADAATETESRELDMTRQLMFQARMTRIDDALGRIRDGTYGRCAVCGEQIPEERLEIVPETAYCVRHAAHEERG